MHGAARQRLEAHLAGVLITTLAVLAPTACSSSQAITATPTTPATSPATPSPSPVPTLPPPPTVRTVKVATVPQPVGMAIRRGDPALYIVSKAGKVWALRAGHVDPIPALDISGQVSDGSEQGLLGLAFSPDGRFAYINYTDRKGDTNVVEYAWTNGRADLSTRRLVLFVDQPFPNHNGGNLVFGPDGYLYVGLGDGGSNGVGGDPQGDPHRNGQNVGVLLGKMLRIEPRLPNGSLPTGGTGYAIPADNPFVHRSGARAEIWAFGLRNPWRYSFDRRTGDLWIGDVGAGAREEVDLQPAGSSGGQNYGWNILEGSVEWGAPPPDAVRPVYEYPHLGVVCAVTGGYVYRGSAIPALRGWYVFGDFCSGEIDALRLVDGHEDAGAVGPIVRNLASFGQDQRGELYALSLSGGVFMLVP